MTPQERAEKHWDGYVGPMQRELLAHMVEVCMAMSRFHYVTSHVHGVKHEQQDAKETARAAFTPHSGGTEELLSTALRALCLTRDYVEPNVSLPAKEGWEWFDAGVKLSAAIPDDKWAKEFDRRTRAAFTPVHPPVTCQWSVQWGGIYRSNCGKDYDLAEVPVTCPECGGVIVVLGGDSQQQADPCAKCATGECNEHKEIAAKLAGTCEDRVTAVVLHAEIDFTLPRITVTGTEDECRQKHHEELAEMKNELAGSTKFFIEAWDVLQAARTWQERCDPVFAGGASMAVHQAEKLLASFTDYNKIRHAKTLALIKNAERFYYAPEVCKVILETNGQRWNPQG